MFDVRTELTLESHKWGCGIHIMFQTPKHQSTNVTSKLQGIEQNID